MAFMNTSIYYIEALSFCRNLITAIVCPPSILGPTCFTVLMIMCNLMCFYSSWLYMSFFVVCMYTYVCTNVCVYPPLSINIERQHV